MVELFSEDIVPNDHPSSKGNQLKWKTGGEWFKADAVGYEGLAEYVVSHLLRYSSLREDQYVLYDTVQIRYRDKVFLGCRCKDFLMEGSQLFTWERLYRNLTGRSLYVSAFHFPEVKERLSFIVSQMERAIGISGIGEYLTCLVEIDSVFLNEDRHMHNIAAIRKPDGSYAFSPIFDHGASLLSDTALDYPMGKDIYELIILCRSKTLAWSFIEQLEAEDVYGVQIHFSFGEQEIDEVLGNEPYYPAETKERVKRILLERKRQHGYLFS
ncbi:MAG: hypothetical protein IJM83_07010 [Firmicutes bacterium]|nr:hypothetical protein [Bacillota bacterium]